MTLILHIQSLHITRRGKRNLLNSKIFIAHFTAQYYALNSQQFDVLPNDNRRLLMYHKLYDF